MITDTFIISNTNELSIRIRKRVKKKKTISSSINNQGLFDNFLYMIFEAKMINGELVKRKSRISPKDYVSLNEHCDSTRRKIQKLRIYFMSNLEQIYFNELLKF